MEILLDLFIKYFMSFISAIIIVIFREVIKSIAAHFVMHPIHRASNKIEKNIFKYIDPLGIIMFVFFNVGWQKPAEYTPRKYSYKEKGALSVALTGFVSSLLLGAAALMGIRFAGTGLVREFLTVVFVHSIGITIINLMPVPPLDMTKILYATAPNTYFKIIQNKSLIQVIFLLVLVLNIFGYIVYPIANIILNLVV